jgi:hypothetical protein
MQKTSFWVIPLLSLAQVAGAAPITQDQATWETFVDKQYGTSVQYPSWFSIPDGQPELGTGERWITPDGRAEIEIYSLANPSRDTPRGYLAKQLRLSPAALHYERVTNRFFALSAIKAGKIRYTRSKW